MLSASSRATLGYNRALDGLRAFAVAAVVAEHAGYTIAGLPVQGSFGVCVFFVISGFLITGLLLAEHERTGRIGVRAFYRRRWARLMPALATVVELRGSVRRPAVDTPYGRLASVIDPTGAPFNLMGPSRETPAPDTSA